MADHRTSPPQLGRELFLTDGGLETDLVFHHGVELPCFAAYPLVEDRAGRQLLSRYLEPYLSAAARAGTGFVLETPTWRANRDWGAELGHDPARVAAANRTAVEWLDELRHRVDQPAPMVISGCIGPRGDGYRPTSFMDADEAERYHAEQIAAFTASGADLVSAFTMTNIDEAIGIVRAARAHEVPAVISFTVETDGRLPTGAALADAVEAVDAATDDGPAYYMINCAHPTHFAETLEPGAAWTRRLGGVRANASVRSHAELDEATELDDGDPVDFAERCLALREAFPQLSVLGGCCGTDHRHVGAIAARAGRPAGADQRGPGGQVVDRGSRAGPSGRDPRGTGPAVRV